MTYDFLIVGAGIFGCTMANILANKGKSVLIIDKNIHIGGACYDYESNGINIHKYGAHIFHTSKEDVWEYINQFTSFNNFINSPIAIYKNETYNLPFNMNTFSKMWNIKQPEEAKKIINKQILNAKIGTPKNLEEQAIKLVGKDIYEKLIKEYTEKQWGCSCDKLSSEIIKRIPVRFTYDNNYFNDKHQGIPENGYTPMLSKMINHKNIKIILDCSLDNFTKKYKNINYDKMIYTGSIDELCNFCLNKKLKYRSVIFKNIILQTSNFQGNAVINYTSSEVPYTRTIEHKFFETGKKLESNLLKPYTVVSYEYPVEDGPKYYPINDESNTKIYNEYLEILKSNYENKIYIGGRMGSYKYINMDEAINQAFKLSEIILDE